MERPVRDRLALRAELIRGRGSAPPRADAPRAGARPRSSFGVREPQARRGAAGRARRTMRMRGLEPPRGPYGSGGGWREVEKPLKTARWRGRTGPRRLGRCERSRTHCGLNRPTLEGAPPLTRAPHHTLASCPTSPNPSRASAGRGLPSECDRVKVCECAASDPDRVDDASSGVPPVHGCLCPTTVGWPRWRAWCLRRRGVASGVCAA